MEKLCIVATERKAIGYVCLPYIVETDRQPSYFLIEPATTDLIKKGRIELNEKEQFVVSQLSALTDLALTKRFAKGKTVREFYDKSKPELFELQVIPFISRTILEVLPIIVEEGITLFHKQPGYNNLYETDIVEYRQHLSRPKCFFTLDAGGILRYSLSITDKIGGEIREKQLTDRNVVVLSHNPASLIVDNILYRFDNIDAKKFEPFVKKRFIAILPTTVDKYMNTFVRKCVMDYYVVARGFQIKKIDSECMPMLSLEQDVMGYSLHLYMQYGNQKYAYGTTNRNVELKKENNSYVFYSGIRKLNVEQHIAEQLEEIGLVHDDNGCMVVKRPNDMTTTANDAYSFVEWISTNSETIKKLGIEVEISEELNYYHSFYDLRVEPRESDRTDWFDLQAVVVLEGFEIPFIKLRNHIIRGNREYKLPDGKIFILPEDWFTSWTDIMQFAQENNGCIRIDQMHKTLLPPYVLQTGESIDNTSVMVSSKTPMQGQLKATLRPYQEEGFRWLLTLYENHKGGILADDMGLGKTIQAIALLSHVYYTAEKRDDDNKDLFKSFNNTILGPTLIVLPVSLIHNWENEISRFAPHLRVYEYGGKNRIKTADIGKILRHYHIVLTTYGTLRNDIKYLRQCKFGYLIIDESQAIKNPSSLTYHSTAEIVAEHYLTISGTPIENSLSDLWAQMNLVNKGFLGSHSFFKNYFSNPIEKNNDEEKQEKLKRLISPFILRRTKDTVARDLPPVTEQTIICEMTQEQHDIYEREKSGCRNELLHLTDNALKTEAFATLKALTRLRLIANHPKLAIPEYDGRSGKTDNALELIESVAAEGHKTLVFSSFVRDLELVKAELDKRNIRHCILTGQTTNRQDVINAFQNDPQIKVFLISLKAGGVGLNLTQADYVLMMNPWWNPQAEQQAIDRAHRIGQKKNVMVYRFITQNTIEEKIAKLQEKKKHLAGLFINSNNPLSSLSAEEIRELIS